MDNAIPQELEPAIKALTVVSGMLNRSKELEADGQPSKSHREMICDLFADIRNMPEPSESEQDTLYYRIMRNVQPGSLRRWRGVMMLLNFLLNPEVCDGFAAIETPVRRLGTKQESEGYLYRWEDLRIILLAFQAGTGIDFEVAWECLREGCGEDLPPVRLENTNEGLVLIDASGLI